MQEVDKPAGDEPSKQFSDEEYAKLQVMREKLGLGHLKGKKRKWSEGGTTPTE